MQHARHLLMIRPRCFGFNPETASSNVFQHLQANADGVAARAIDEFNRMGGMLTRNRIQVHVLDDDLHNNLPDAVFPNNWLATLPTGELIIFPMMTASRRKEKRKEVIEWVQQHFHVKRLIDFSYLEKENKFAEGTGSLVFDHSRKIAYACLSTRTSAAAVMEICRMIEYTPILFEAFSTPGMPVYHTNVMMAVAGSFAVICLECIPDRKQQQHVYDSLAHSRHKVIIISREQMNDFAGNMLTVETNEGKAVTILSQAAFEVLSDEQIESLLDYSQLIPIAIPVIEKSGGGSVRCMMAEVFLDPVPV